MENDSQGRGSVSARNFGREFAPSKKNFFFTQRILHLFAFFNFKIFALEKNHLKKRRGNFIIKL